MTTINCTRVRAPNPSSCSNNSTLDATDPNPPGPHVGNNSPCGRSTADDNATHADPKKFKIQKKKKKYQKIKKRVFNSPSNVLNIATFNCRTLADCDWKKWELISKAAEYGLDIIGIQEHRILTKDELIINGYKLSNPLKSSNNSTIGGIGLLLSPSAQKAYIDHTIISPLIMSASFTGNPTTHVITCHSPTNASTEEDVDSFYHDLSEFLDTIPAHDLVIIAGDLNAHLGVDLCGVNAYYDITNRNGIKLHDFASEHSLTLGYPKFTKRRTKKVTWIAPNLDEHQNDHILIRSKWQNSLKNVESFIKPDIKSDHRIVTARIKMSLRQNIKKSTTVHLDWNPLKTDKNINAAFVRSFHNRYTTLAEETTMDEVPEHCKNYTNMITAIQHAASKTLCPKPKPGVRNLLHNDPSYIQAQRLRDKAIKQYSLRKTRAASKDLKEYTTQLANVEQEILSRYVNKAIDEIDVGLSRSDSAGQAWKLINKVTGRKQKSSSILKGFTSVQDRKQAWVDHYHKLLYNPADNISTDNIDDNDPLPIITDPFSEDEYFVALKQLKETSSLDGVPTSVYKNINLCPILLPILNSILLAGQAPPEMLLTGILPIPKGNSKFIPCNSRGISILPVITKLLNRLLLNRIRPHVDPLLRINQNGFRPERGTREHILAMRRIIEEVINHNLPLCATFIDFSKAFDSLLRSKLPNILSSYGIPHQIIKAVMSLYTNTRATVITPEGLTLEFLTNLGILQGDVLAPFIFIVVLDFIMRNAIRDSSHGLTINKRKSTRYPAVEISDFEFADDIAALSNSVFDNNILCQKISDSAAICGLNINMKKTQFITFNLQDYTNDSILPVDKSGPLRPKPHFMSGLSMHLNSIDIEEVADFKYLGAYIRSTAADIRIRKGMAWKALNSMNTCWKSTLSRKTKIRLFKATVESVLLYGCETWTMSAALDCVIDGFYTRLLRRIFGISWKSHTTNRDLYGALPKLSNTIRDRRLRFAGHIYRHDQQIANTVLFWTPSHGKRKRGHPFLTYVDVLCKDTGLSVLELKSAMLDRKAWWTIVDKELDT